MTKNPKTNSAIKIIGIDEEKCVNCHMCIATCPVKFCNDGSQDHVKINDNLCIGCGNCLTSCTHDARFYIDDFDTFLQDSKTNTKIILIVAPSVVANFKDAYLQLNTWFKELGVEAIFDVSFGAELTVASYLNYIEEEQPKTVISQPCPAIVSYIEIYQPELIKHLIPIDSPMLHTIKYIKANYPKYKNHKIAALSPCLAKKREFESTGFGDYNIAFKSVQKHLADQSISLQSYEKLAYDNPPAERAVLFSSPGGLLQTIDRWNPEIKKRTRKIEGTNSVYDYLDGLPDVIDKNIAPLLVDCLNCDKGCNGGPLTAGKDLPIDEIEFEILKRSDEMINSFKNNNQSENINETIHKLWQKELYSRTYKNCSTLNCIKIPEFEELKSIYESMHKYDDKDIYNCASCGYEQCEKMAIAIFNGLNKPENCHFYLSHENDIQTQNISQEKNRLANILDTMLEGFIQLDNEGIIKNCNNTIRTILGVENLIDRHIFDILPENQTSIYDDHIKLVYENNNADYEIKLIHTSGKELYVIFNHCILKDNENSDNGTFIIIADRTIQKEYETSLVIEKTRLQNIFENMGEGFIELDTNGIITYSNESCKNILQLDELIGRNVLDFLRLEDIMLIISDPEQQLIPSSNDPQKLKQLAEYINTRLPLGTDIQLVSKLNSFIYEVKIVNNHGETIYASFNHRILLDDNKENIGSFMIISDLTERKLHELELYKAKDELEIRVEERTAELTETVNCLTAAEEEIRQQTEEIIAQRDSLHEKTEQLTQMLSMLTKSQSKLVESEKMVALGQLIAGVAHEVNTPLGAIRSSIGYISNTLETTLLELPKFFNSLDADLQEVFFKLLKQSLQRNNATTSKEERKMKRKLISLLEKYDIEDSDEYADTLVDMGIYDAIEEFLPLLKNENADHILQNAYKISGLLRSSQTITTAAERASKVVFALKNFAHFDQSGEKAKANVSDLIETVITLYHNQIKQGVELIKNFELIPDIMCYPDELNQVWTNLIHNALQAMDHKGVMTIDLTQDDNNIMVKISDTGSGIPEPIQDKIFNAFFTTKAQGEGSGLGLDIVKRIIEKHEGEITFTSKPGNTTFTVKLKKNLTE